MKYYTSKQVADKLAVTKRYINKMCVNGKIPNAYKDGYRWMIPATYVCEDITEYKCLRSFNTVGVCNSSEHYMVDLKERLIVVKKLIDEQKYFTINRARQFGKTTTLYALQQFLHPEYFVVSMDFQMQMSSAKYKDENTFSLAFAKAFINSFQTNPLSNQKKYKEAIMEFKDSFLDIPTQYDLVELFQALSILCGRLPKKVVLLIDEVDLAANNQVFLDFLAQLRGYYIHRYQFPTFQSVILAGVCDIKNLKRKMRPDEEHKDNSPWNIAADFNIDMSFTPKEIESMLFEYENDHHTNMDIQKIAQEIYDYTNGYPYLVSRICQLIDQNDPPLWSHQGVLNAVNQLIKESNSLFEDMAKKIKDYHDLNDLLREVLFAGRNIPFHMGNEIISIGVMYGFFKENNGQVAISNRIFETWLYNLFIAQEAIYSSTYHEGELYKSQFIENNQLNMEFILSKFVEHFNECFKNSSEKFIEDQGRKIFLLYIRPLINGIGNYYIEARTRSLGRTDLIIDYQGKQYVIEMKIWHGNSYNERAKQQLIGYLEDYQIEKGYLLSFNFNQSKQVGVKEIKIDQYTIIEAVV